MSSAQIAAVLIRSCVETEMKFSRSMVTAKGTARLDLIPPQRSGVKDEPTPPGRIHNGNFLINTAQLSAPPAFVKRLAGLRLTAEQPVGRADLCLQCTLP